MPKIQLRGNVSYSWLGQVREGYQVYEMDDGEAEYVKVSGFEYDPDEKAPEAAEPGRFAVQIAASRAAIEAKEKPAKE